MFMYVHGLVKENKVEVATVYKKLKEILEDCADDVIKFESGNKAAGMRIRKAMQEIKAQAQAVRQAVLKKRNDMILSDNPKD